MTNFNEGDLSAAFAIYDLMMKRRYERYAYALSLLDKEPDLKGNDQIEIDREKPLSQQRKKKRINFGKSASKMM